MLESCVSLISHVNPNWITALLAIVGFPITFFAFLNLIKKQRADFFEKMYSLFFLDKNLKKTFLLGCIDIHFN